MSNLSKSFKTINIRKLQRTTNTSVISSSELLRHRFKGGIIILNLKTTINRYIRKTIFIDY